ncbi:GNAT family N-acetyltransferase [Actinomycetospora lutea]|uniref:GNAT family N-acetyltransferase n=1 Tax=Actinomycetospora lutea TaxID=663604 RepID=UPI002366EF9A|nr:GNAT family N-acetyltransferase [Actinomycetospora lutea]MDD7942511.1 GNAT family N-acetyltransferase [Actinomycetospora lutea]
MTASTEAVITTYGAEESAQTFDVVTSIYSEVYAEAPYHEGPDDFAGFAESLPHRAKAPSFRVVIAAVAGEAVGFALGHQLTPNTKWWDGALQPLPRDLTTEWPGRTFAVIEIAVRGQSRRRGYAAQLHAHLIAGLAEERLTLLVRPDAEPAHRAYTSWGYERVGQIQPFDDAPVYDAMIRPLRDAPC